jgi:hypothetical protein
MQAGLLGAGAGTVTGLVSASPATPGPDNKATIDAALAAALPGEVLTFPAPAAGQVYWTSGGHAVPSGVKLQGSAWDYNLPMFKVIPTTSQPAVFASANWINNVPTADRGVLFAGLSIDVNGVSMHGIAFMGKANCAFHCYVKNWRGAFAGIFTDAATQNATNCAGVCQENQIYFNKLDGTATGNITGHHSIWVAKSAANTVTDSDIGFNILTGSGDDQVHLDSGGDWWIYRNHLYKNWQGAVINIASTSSGDHIIDNQSDSFGFTCAGGVTYYGIKVVGSPGNVPPEIRGNSFQCDEANLPNNGSGGSGNYVYLSYQTNISGGNTVYLNLSDNNWRQASATLGTSTCYSFNNTGGGTLVVNVKDYEVQGTTIAAAPVIVAGTVSLVRSATANIVKVASPVPVSGTGFVPSTTSDTAGTIALAGAVSGTYSITMGPTTGAENTIVTGASLPNGVNIIVALPKVPAGWTVIVTVTNATIGHTLFVTL